MITPRRPVAKWKDAIKDKVTAMSNGVLLENVFMYKRYEANDVRDWTKRDEYFLNYAENALKLRLTAIGWLENLAE